MSKTEKPQPFFWGCNTLSLITNYALCLGLSTCTLTPLYSNRKLTFHCTLQLHASDAWYQKLYCDQTPQCHVQPTNVEQYALHTSSLEYSTVYGIGFTFLSELKSPNKSWPSCVNVIHDGYDRRKQQLGWLMCLALRKLGLAFMDEADRQQGDFNSKKSKPDPIYSGIF